MKHINILVNKAWLVLVGLLIFSSCNDDQSESPVLDMPEMGQAPDVSFVGLTNDNRIATFNARSLNNPMDVRMISNLPDGEQIISIDFRPATGQLYALGSSSRLYHINELNGRATALGSGPFEPRLNGANASIDFNPTVDRIRLVTESGQNLRLHPELGTVVATDGQISGGNSPRIGAIGYTNSVAGATSTLLFDIDFQNDRLFVQDPPNDGGLRDIGPLGIDFQGVGNFDISPSNEFSLAVTFVDNESKLYTINLENGKATWVGTFNLPIIGLSFKTDPVVFATLTDNSLARINPSTGAMSTVAIGNLNTGETVTGIDFRPRNGALYGVTNQNRLITINTANGQVAQVGSALSPMIDGAAVGFDFNPLVDRIRLVTNTGQNLRLHPDLGTVVATDGMLNPNDPNVTGAAYTNNFDGTTSTLLYVVDSESNMLMVQDPPNDGVLVARGPLGIMIGDSNGFDIGGFTDNAYGIFTVGTTTGLYSINLSSGQATLVRQLSSAVTGMAVGLGF